MDPPPPPSEISVEQKPSPTNDECMDPPPLEIDIPMEQKPSPNNDTEKLSLPTPPDGGKYEFASLDEYVQYEGFWYPPSILKSLKVVQDKFQAQPGDIMLATCPKSGTTWLKALAFAIMTRDQYGDQKEGQSPSPLLYTFPHNCIPYIEQPHVASKSPNHLVYEEYPGGGRRLLATHIPYTSLPQSISRGCKVVYLCRDPKDMLVSWWYFWCNGMNKPVPLHEFFVKFCEGKHMFGPCWDHILGYWKASRENPQTVLFLKYEDLKKDTFGCVKRLAEFMGCPFSSGEEEAGRVEEVVKLCSFDSLSNLEVNKLGKYEINPGTSLFDNRIMFRRGQVGDWKQHLTLEMKHEMDRIAVDKFSGCEYEGLQF